MCCVCVLCVCVCVRVCVSISVLACVCIECSLAHYRLATYLVLITPILDLAVGMVVLRQVEGSEESEVVPVSILLNSHVIGHTAWDRCTKGVLHMQYIHVSTIAEARVVS